MDELDNSARPVLQFREFSGCAMRKSANLRKCVFAFLLLLTVCRGGPLREVFKRTETLMGTVVEVRVVTADREKAEAAINDAFRVMREAEGRLSFYRPDSEISRLNAAGSLVVSPLTFNCIEKAVKAGRLTSGAFDITAGPLVKLWQEAGRLKQLPTPEQIEAARGRVGYERIGLDPIKRRVTLSADTRIDLGATATGYAVDMAIDVLRRRGITSAVVNAGGNLYVLGRALDDGPWRVRVPNPFAPNAKPFVATAGLKDMACVSSEYYHRRVEIDGKRYSDVIDPRTGWPVEAAASVTVVAPTTAMADALAAGICVLGPEEGIALAERLSDVYVLVITGDKDNMKIRASSGWRKISWQDSGQGE